MASLDLVDQQPHLGAGAPGQIGERPLAAGGVGRDRPQQVAQLPRALAEIEARMARGERP